MEEMNYEIRQLPAAGYDDDGNPEPEREMDNKIALDDYEPSGSEINDLWVHAVEGEIEAESHDDALKKLWPLYNRGSGQARLKEMEEAEMPSLSVNDIVIIDSTVYLCASIGWKEIGLMSDRVKGGVPMDS